MEEVSGKAMADALRQKASAAYLDDDFVSAIDYFSQAISGPLP